MAPTTWRYDASFEMRLSLLKSPPGSERRATTSPSRSADATAGGALAGGAPAGGAPAGGDDAAALAGDDAAGGDGRAHDATSAATASQSAVARRRRSGCTRGPTLMRPPE